MKPAVEGAARSGPEREQRGQGEGGSSQVRAREEGGVLKAGASAAEQVLPGVPQDGSGVGFIPLRECLSLSSADVALGTLNVAKNVGKAKDKSAIQHSKILLVPRTFSPSERLKSVTLP